MRVAFYAPLKAPDHPIPSGDRRMAHLLMRALDSAGHEVTLASRLRSRDGAGDPERQDRLARLGGRIADRLVRRCRALPSERRPQLWFTYHLYYKAADWIGPIVARALEIPYVVAEASVAHKRAGGPWSRGHEATLAALDRAAAVIALNPADVPALPKLGRVRQMPPFLDEAPFAAAADQRAEHRRALAGRSGLDPEALWIVVVAMMRPGDKQASYEILARVLARVPERPDNRAWHLLVIGDGPARPVVEQQLTAALGDRWVGLGSQPPEAMPALLAACDLMVWPAVNEAYGMALLEGQAAGLPLVAGSSGGVAGLVEDGATAILCATDDVDAMSTAVGGLLEDPGRRTAMGRAALRRVAATHGLEAGARRLDRILAEAATPP